eukprot:snap_masked-scaffold_19-processed-gene-1.21-mRNA-1 protein AED:1.00 eAED:1.00 QI:0/0/0/0/1/1/2/0/87
MLIHHLAQGNIAQFIIDNQKKQNNFKRIKIPIPLLIARIKLRILIRKIQQRDLSLLLKLFKIIELNEVFCNTLPVPDRFYEKYNFLR